MSTSRKAALLIGLGCLLGGHGASAFAQTIETQAAGQVQAATAPGETRAADTPLRPAVDMVSDSRRPEIAATPASIETGPATAGIAPVTPATDDPAETASVSPKPDARGATPSVGASGIPTEAAPVVTASPAGPGATPSIFTPVAPAAAPEPAAAPMSVAPAVTAAPAVTVTPSAPVAQATPPVADPVVGALQARLDDLKATLSRRLPRAEREALAAYYVGTAFRPIWVAKDGWTAPARALIARLEGAEEDGLDPAEYPVPRLGVAADAPRSDNPVELAEAEFKLSAAALLYARDARGGRIDPARISALITPKLELPGAEALMTRLAGTADPAAALGAYNPAYPGYVALKARLAQIRATSPGPMVRRVPAIRGATRVASLDATAPAPRLEGDVVANMERWRWLPAEVAPRYIFVNIPEFRLELIENARPVHEARVIVGKPDSPTPIFSGEMEYAVVNPSWYIPPSIMKKEILPGLAADPNYAARRGYEVVRRNGQVSVRQPPGERNALGFIKFLFPNQHAVYLHDTPNRNLFSATTRAFSHGCVRVDQPFALADFVLGRDWPESRLRKLIGRGERTIRMGTKLPVHLAYFTMMADASGELRSFGDLYGINRRVRQALGFGA